MPSIQVKNVPEEVHRALQERARASGQSLQEFLQGELRRIADRATLDQIFKEAQREGGTFTFDEVIEAIHAERKGD
ncbi:MAG: hypothetical protein KDB54_00335 [Solirubrobacterales bacterium]|nr:hypothetical protein [Solirubrobacterales bacterium]HRV59595.1 hypothetical protein [Solirubrobacterales bacterium]